MVNSFEVEIIISRVTGISRASIKARIEQHIDATHAQQIIKLCQQRAEGVPIAYLFNEREFWGLSLYVDERVLIPRHETELIIEYCLEKYALDSLVRCIDLGTGSGAIALALAKNFSKWEITAVDQSKSALVVAKNNANNLQIDNVQFIQSSWFQQVEQKQFDLIISNPPYIAENDQHLQKGDLRYEPYQALAAKHNGLKALQEIILSSPHYLVLGGMLILEHGYDQGDAVQQLLKEQGFSSILTHQDYASLDRYTTAIR